MKKILNILFVKPSHLTIKYFAKNNLTEYSKNVDEQLRISNILIYFYSCFSLFLIKNIDKQVCCNALIILSLLFVFTYFFSISKLAKFTKNKICFNKVISILEFTTNMLNPIFVPIATLTSSILIFNTYLYQVAFSALIIALVISMYYLYLLKYFEKNKEELDIILKDCNKKDTED